MLPVFLGPVTRTAAGQVVVVTGDEARHAVVVRRLTAGGQVVLVDGGGTSATCTVLATARSSLEARVETVTRRPPPVPAVTVVQAFPKGDRAKLAVEVLTEIGVDRIVPWAAARAAGCGGGSGPRSR